jgi:hypothetical protein
MAEKLLFNCVVKRPRLLAGVQFCPQFVDVGEVSVYLRLMNQLVFGVAPTKEEAASIGREEAKRLGVEHIIKNMDGTIAQRNSCGHDPRDIPG